MEYDDYMSALVAVTNWNGSDIDELADAIRGMWEHGAVEGPMFCETLEDDVAGAVLRMQGRQPASTIWEWPEDEDLVAQDASSRRLTWSELGAGCGYAA